ncbi:aminopeptidase [Lutibacter sp.]|uniref:aminopeptidase n=1 Tax=Lutibacter sp. TaxID=1925666 RepID=UPI00356A3848
MKKNLFILLLLYFISLYTYAQTNNINISATLNIETNELKIQQETTFYNKSDSILNVVYFHNWANAYKDKKTPLAKRFIENYSKTFHFTNNKNRGNTTINNISVNYDNTTWEITDENPDILKVNLNQSLYPNDSVIINATYIVKIPNDKFTNYGASYFSYNLRYWYLAPANFSNSWQTYNNLDLDDLYIDFTNYHIDLKVPIDYVVNCNLTASNKPENDFNNYILVGKNKLDIELNITKNNDFIDFNFEKTLISTNLDSEKLDYNLKHSILKREFYFIQSFLGKFPNEKLLINKIEYDKNPVYGFNQLPSFLTAYSDAFEWDIQLFKVLSKKYIDELFLFNKREDYWLADGLQSYLMIKYVEMYYPEVKAIGNISEVWGIKGFNLAKIKFNEKYPFVYQFAARKNIDQALTTQADSLSNFNRKIVNKYKAGLGIKYLETYLEDNTMSSIIWNFSSKNSGNKVKSKSFIDYIKSITNKDISWFENEYLETTKKVDYTIQKITKNNDSLDVTILNKRNFTTPIQLYGIKDKEIKFTKWLTGIDSISKITIPKDGFDKLSLNYESLLPEFNLRNNWKNVEKKLFNRPFQLKFMKDIENPYYNQFFYTPVFRYNYYDGAVLGLALSNKTILDKNFNYKLTPSYGTTSKTLSGTFALKYEYHPENEKVNKLIAGIAGSSFHYAENLTYTAVTPFALLEFKRKSLRDVGSNAISTSYTLVDRKKSPNQIEHNESNKYNVFNLSYGYAKPEIIEDIRFSTDLQVSDKFSKISLTGHYRKLTDTNRQFDFRIFAGAFLSNNTESDFFSFALDRPSDYLFQYDYLGRSETSGFFSQQVIINEGGFKSKLPVAYGNQWLSTINTSIGLWRWLEVYNDVGFVKNRNQKVYFAHENGIRFNFIQDILEVYFPLHSNLGWEVSQPSYSSKIRFVLVLNPKRIFNFVKRGFY